MCLHPTSLLGVHTGVPTVSSTCHYSPIPVTKSAYTSHHFQPSIFFHLTHLDVQITNREHPQSPSVLPRYLSVPHPLWSKSAVTLFGQTELEHQRETGFLLLIERNKKKPRNKDRPVDTFMYIATISTETMLHPKSGRSYRANSICLSEIGPTLFQISSCNLVRFSTLAVRPPQ